MAAWDGLYCTDEDFAQRAVGDFARLLPFFQTVAAGSDGVIEESDRWTLSSAGCPFNLTGLGAGHVAVLNCSPRDIGPSSNALFGVAGPPLAGPPSSVRLRGLGADDVVPGMPPSPGVGITFRFPTVRGQIRQATGDLGRQYKIGSAAELEDPIDFRRATVLLVYMQLLLTQAMGRDGADAWIAKLRLLMKEWEEVTSILDATYGPATAGQEPVIEPMDRLELVGPYPRDFLSGSPRPRALGLPGPLWPGHWRV